uniref:trypsin-like serine protease n=1 Tax=Candidatus Electronema sp. TaxID=2698783 RepID=UPI0040572513
MLKKNATAAAWTAALSLLFVMPAAAVTNGELDGDRHPYVGLMVAQDADGNPLWRCSGTLLSPKIFLTAGHCTESPAAHVEIWFDADVESGIPANGYPFTGQVGGTPHVHPQYDPNRFFLHDLGVVVLENSVYNEKNEYGILPTLDQLDTLKTRRGKQDVTFTAVGYGLQESFPDAASWKENNQRVRMVSRPHLLQINTPGFTGDFSLLLSNNHATGGTCFGDSGGPNFIGDSNFIGGVTSFGCNGNCAGTGGVYRVDRADDLDWLHEIFGAYLP